MAVNQKKKKYSNRHININNRHINNRHINMPIILKITSSEKER